MVVAAWGGLGGVGDVLLVVALAPHLVCRLVELLVGGLQFLLTLVVPLAVEVDMTDGAIGFKQFRPICVRRDHPIDVELLLRMSVLLKEMEVVGCVDLHLPELLLPLVPQHVHVMGTSLVDGHSAMHQRGEWRRLVVSLRLPAESNVGHLFLLLRCEPVLESFRV
ncbi:hypothetical protein D1007_51897 [Hordeum vulgare]|nr:hypothetical protein D1007_51897 [Hordeum vulgare]